MDARLKQVLSLVIEDVIETGEPVGSQYLVDTYHLKVSSATIRNWFVELEDQGYIIQQHTSSGRVPTEKGYRLYVEELLDSKPLPKKAQQELAEACDTHGDTARKVKALAKTVADLAESAVVVGLEDADSFYTGLSYLFAQPEFRDWNRVVSLSEALERLDEILQEFGSERYYNHPTALIGRACPFGNACGVILLTLPNATFFGLLGPMRMNYREGLALLSAAQKLINNEV